MSPSTTTRSPQRRRINTEVKLDELLAEFETRVAIVKAAEEKKAAAIKKATDEAGELYAEEVGDAPEELVKLQEELAEFLLHRRHTLISRFKKTIKRPMGEVKYIHDDPEMDWPKDESSVVRHLENRMDGMNYLIPVSPKLDKKAILKSAPPELLAELRSYGVWKGPHLIIRLKTASMKAGVTVLKRRYKEQPPRKK